MASNVYVTFKLEPFYQAFLRSYYVQREILFEFPKGSDINLLLGFISMKQPREQIKSLDFGNEAFHVLLPNMEYKNVLVYNYISHTGRKVFQQKVEDLFKLVFHSHVDRAIHKDGIRKRDALMLFLEKYELDDFSSDRVTKSYQRYIDKIEREYDRYKSAQRQNKFRKKTKKKLSVTKPQRPVK